MLDLVDDTLIEPAPGTSRRIRRLRFAGHGWVADVDVRGTEMLTLDVRLSPDEPTIMEVRTADADGHVETQHRGRGPFTDVSPGLTSVLIRWPEVERRPARTAWVRL